MTPYISVVVPTMRVGGLDVLWSGLVQQTFKDFELVLVDGIQARIGSIDFPGIAWQHVAPFNNEFPVASFCHYANTGLVHARGEIVFMMVDYTWLPPETLEAHAAWHRRHDDPRAALMMPHEYRELPVLAFTFGNGIPFDYRSGTGDPALDNAEARRYAQNVASGAHDAHFWSIFNHPFNADDDARHLAVHPKWGGADPKNRLVCPPGESVLLDNTYFHAKNESVKRSMLLDANGWDEDLDGTHCFQDNDLSDRLTRKHDVTWFLRKDAIAQIVNPRTVFPFAERERDYMTNLLLWKSKQAAGYVEPVNTWSLREKRKELRIDG
ncbi:MAG TPA: glycosyltransferase [Terriglobales bacterium]|nr:glycosyltransferase [Terriglobales bacterium]